MLRILLQYLLPLLLPFLVYMVYVAVARGRTPGWLSEAPWPHLAALETATAAAGGRLRERLAIYPEYIRRPGFVPDPLRDRVRAAVDAAGLVPERAAAQAAGRPSGVAR